MKSMELQRTGGFTWGLATATAIVTLSACGAADDSTSNATDTSSAAFRDRRAPTAPGNFRVTSKTSFSAALAWTPSSDDSGNFSYYLTSTVSGGGTVTLPSTATSFTWTAGLAPRNFYTFLIYARDSAGNASRTASVSASLPADTVAPFTPPVLSVNGTGSTWISLEWTPAQDDGPFLFYQVLLSGAPYANVGSVTSTTLHLLEPETSYALSVRAHDYGPNWSAPSNVVDVATLPPNPNDTTPPTTPANLRGGWFDDGEVHLRWDPATDNLDPQSVIRYDVYVNGVLSDTLVGTFRKSIVYANVGELNRFEVIASDTAGNAAAPAILDLFLGN
jgi:hypothetical protein